MFKELIREFLREWRGFTPPTLYAIRKDTIGLIQPHGWPHDSFMYDFFDMLTDGEIAWDHTGQGVILNDYTCV